MTILVAIVALLFLIVVLLFIIAVMIAKYINADR
jgi:hypothetical protein